MIGGFIMKKYFLSLFLCLTLMTGCSATPPNIQKVQKQPVNVDIPQLTTTDKAQEGYASFAVELLCQSRKEGENTLVAPISVAVVLSMTANGSAGDTLAEFQTLFGMDLDTLNAYCTKALQEYSNLGGSTKSTFVNSLWYNPALTLKDDFVAQCQQNYGAELYQADLQNAATVQAVNDWVSQATNGLIPKTVDNFSKLSIMALVNAIYLQNKFEAPFETPHSDWEMDFTAADGTISHPKGMYNGMREEWYLSHTNGSGVLLPYDDGRLGFLLMLPKEGMGLSDYLSVWDEKTVKFLLDNREKQMMSLTVPKYEIEWEASLTDILASMNLTKAFDPYTADFTAMGSTTSNNPIFIGDVIHKTVLKVNEKGTEAAAVTVAEIMESSAMLPNELIELRFDRPFICGIVDLETEVPLFLGTVEDLKK